MNYKHIFSQAIDRLHSEGRYRVFIDILRNKGAFPNARCFHGHNGPKPITVWCSNDYLAMGQHPKVVAAMEEALHDVGAGSGGTRNIGGNTHYHIDLEAELADLHGKEGALLADLLKLLLKIRAREIDVAPRLLTRSGELEQLAAGVRDLPILEGWRREVFGRDALDLVEGKLAFAVEKGKLKMTHIDDVED